MTDELKPCPFCGGEADLIMGANWYQVGCRKCDITTATMPMYDNVDRAVALWNTRIAATDEQFSMAVHDGEIWIKKRTCRNLYRSGSELGEGGFRCSLCDCEAYGTEPNFCYSCGAEVEK